MNSTIYKIVCWVKTETCNRWSHAGTVHSDSFENALLERDKKKRLYSLTGIENKIDLIEDAK